MRPKGTRSRKVSGFFYVVPLAAPRPCKHPGCRELVGDGRGYCAAHKRAAPGSFADRARGSRHQRGYGSAWDKLRLVVMRRDRGLCQPCLAAGHVTAASAVDHILARARGGGDELGNLQAICSECHRRKTDAEKNASRA